MPTDIKHLKIENGDVILVIGDPPTRKLQDDLQRLLIRNGKPDTLFLYLKEPRFSVLKDEELHRLGLMRIKEASDMARQAIPPFDEQRDDKKEHEGAVRAAAYIADGILSLDDPGSPSPPPPESAWTPSNTSGGLVDHGDGTPPHRATMPEINRCASCQALSRAASLGVVNTQPATPARTLPKETTP